MLSIPRRTKFKLQSSLHLQKRREGKRFSKRVDIIAKLYNNLGNRNILMTYILSSNNTNGERSFVTISKTLRSAKFIPPQPNMTLIISCERPFQRPSVLLSFLIPYYHSLLPSSKKLFLKQASVYFFVFYPKGEKNDFVDIIIQIHYIIDAIFKQKHEMTQKLPMPVSFLLVDM